MTTDAGNYPLWSQFVPHAGLLSRVLFVAGAYFVRAQAVPHNRHFCRYNRQQNRTARGRSAACELARLSRVAAMGEPSGAIGHELNQPLTAILSNAQAPRPMLAGDAPDLRNVGQAIENIVVRDRRADEVIERLRGPRRKGLGLSISSTVVNSPGGALQLSNDRRRGVRACFSLPSESPAEVSI